MEKKSITADSDIVSAQIVSLKNKKIILKTEQNKYIEIEYPKSQQKKGSLKIFTEILKDIWHHHLWIPVNQKTNQLLRYDWLS
ncbi:MAG TPA: hypothetical protein H9861_02815 [Candidatus Ligilactobacillus excrementigallinarum]|uniref:Uncharacterized protein n=1 Tax=Candidatus Ligilactobacillus excrementigallinarum TaxID=2838641 RepID=A0A9D1UWJ9_9LACO|nr:hypothetical protein [Candidatus Ligilactobacillus excrementigallinarum]